MEIIRKGILYLSCIAFLLGCKQEGRVHPATRLTSDPVAAPCAEQLYTDLADHLQQGIMLGHQDALAYGYKWYGEPGRSDVKSVCGDYPAVFGWDLGGIERGAAYNVDSVSFDSIRAYMRTAHRLGGISTLSWHAGNPLTGGGYADVSQPDVVKRIVDDPATRQSYLRSLDRMADFIASLTDERGEPIPVILHLFHDPNANLDLWWNTTQCTTADYRRLWMLTVDHLRHDRKLHQLLCAYSVRLDDDTDVLAACYPGDEYVDIVGLSCLWPLDACTDGQLPLPALNRNLAALTQFAEQHGKLPAITAAGLEGIRLSNFFSEQLYPVVAQHKLSYILFWRNAWDRENHYYIPVPGHPAEEDFARFAAQPDILTCKKLTRKP